MRDNILDKSSNTVDNWSIDNRAWQHYFADQIFGRFTRRVRWHFEDVDLIEYGFVRSEQRTATLLSIASNDIGGRIHGWFTSPKEIIDTQNAQVNGKAKWREKKCATELCDMRAVTFYIFKTKYHFNAIAKQQQ